MHLVFSAPGDDPASLGLASSPPGAAEGIQTHRAGSFSIQGYQQRESLTLALTGSANIKHLLGANQRSGGGSDTAFLVPSGHPEARLP